MPWHFANKLLRLTNDSVVYMNIRHQITRLIYLNIETNWINESEIMEQNHYDQFTIKFAKIYTFNKLVMHWSVGTLMNMKAKNQFHQMQRQACLLSGGDTMSKSIYCLLSFWWFVSVAIHSHLILFLSPHSLVARSHHSTVQWKSNRNKQIYES